MGVEFGFADKNKFYNKVNRLIDFVYFFFGKTARLYCFLKPNCSTRGFFFTRELKSYPLYLAI